jgi:hypothetical protein
VTIMKPSRITAAPPRFTLIPFLLSALVRLAINPMALSPLHRPRQLRSQVRPSAREFLASSLWAEDFGLGGFADKGRHPSADGREPLACFARPDGDAPARATGR